jgi:IS1 family transposase
MNRLDSETRAQVIRCLVDGNSIRATVRITGVAKNTVTKLLVQAGAICSEYQDRMLRNLHCRRIQCDEIWSFVGAKDKNVPVEKQGQFGIGSVWTWTAIDADTKLVPCWMVGPRDGGAATEFIQDLAGRLANRVQLTTDGLKMYLTAVADGFGSEIDYAMLVKIYGNDSEGEKRYSPAICTGCKKENKIGSPDEKHVSTSYIERQNLTMRMGMRRFTRLTNAFSKKIENHVAAIALHYMHYNYCRIHQTLRITPAMAAGLTDHVWSIQDLISFLS